MFWNRFSLKNAQTLGLVAWVATAGLMVGVGVNHYLNRVERNQHLRGLPMAAVEAATPTAVTKPVAKQKVIKEDPAWFQGIQKVDAKSIKQLFPEAVGKPLLVEFRSKFCLDCQKLAPRLERTLKAHPTVLSRVFDVNNDRKANALLFKKFDPATVPVTVLITPQGQIYHVFYGEMSESALQKLFTAWLS
jgi:thiol:disulfide interchange protein